jgi:hypothetical protein
LRNNRGFARAFPKYRTNEDDSQLTREPQSTPAASIGSGNSRWQREEYVVGTESLGIDSRTDCLTARKPIDPPPIVEIKVRNDVDPYKLVYLWSNSFGRAGLTMLQALSG